MAAAGPSYASAVARLERATTFGIRPSLDTIHSLMSALGHPERAYRCVQVTGTNGKTSVTRMAGALASGHGMRTGVYTSPHLVSYTERIVIDGAPLSEAGFARALSDVLDAASELSTPSTEFELLTASALHVFRESGVETACLEVGMGGRWDATSVVDPSVAVITGVALDHTDKLGATREEIAADKAHIISERSVPIIGPGCEGLEAVFLNRARSTGHAGVIQVGVGGNDNYDVNYEVLERPSSPCGTLVIDVRSAGCYQVSLHAPAYQAPNVALAIAACEALMGSACDADVVREVFAAMTFPGRFETLRADPPLVIDGAHNPDSAAALAGAIHDAFGARLPVVVLGVLADKDVAGILAALQGSASAFVATENASQRCLPARELAAVIELTLGMEAAVQPDIISAVDVADKKSAGAGVVVTGSLYTAGAAKALVTPSTPCAQTT